MLYLDGFWQVFGGGALGFVILEMIQVASWKRTGKWAQNYRAPEYWIATAFLLLVGGCGAIVYGTGEVMALKAIQLGISAPALFAGYASAADAKRRAREKKNAQFMGVRQTLNPWQRVLAMRAW